MATEALSPTSRRSFFSRIGGGISDSFLLGVTGGAVGGSGATAVGKTLWFGRWGKSSYSQNCEDLIVEVIFDSLGIRPRRYLDIGAADPFVCSNTCRFYERGCRGVLVEPNPLFTGKLRSARPGDVVLEVGVGTGDAGSADYCVIGGRFGPAFNTFSREDAERAVAASKGSNWIEAIVKKPLVTINRIMEQYFTDAAPDFLSIDIEGMDHDVLATLDFGRWRPAVVCAETLIVGTLRMETRTIDLMQSKGYVIRGGNFVNTIFVDGRLLCS